MEAFGNLSNFYMELSQDDGTGDGISIARSYRDAPEIDGYVVVEKELPVGQMAPVLVTGAMEYDLIALPANEPIMVM